MDSNSQGSDKAEQSSVDEDELLAQYGVGSSRFAGSPYALYERHLKFDNVVELESSDERERYEAAARTVRDILSDRWLRTNETYARENPKRVYYVSIEFLIGRSLANNVMNLMLDPLVERAFAGRGRELIEILDQERSAGAAGGVGGERRSQGGCGAVAANDAVAGGLRRRPHLGPRLWRAGLTKGLVYSTKVVGNLTYRKTIARLGGYVSSAGRRRRGCCDARSAISPEGCRSGI